MKYHNAIIHSLPFITVMLFGCHGNEVQQEGVENLNDSSASEDEGKSDPESEPKTCAPGVSVDCSCTNGEQGSQVCAADGESFGECMCKEDQQSLDDYILGLGQLKIKEEEPLMEVECMMDCLPNTEECSYTYYHTTEHFSEFVAFQPNSATLWPGVIVKGGDAQYGLLTPISLPRAPLTFSFSLENLIASPVATMEKPTLSAFRELRNQTLQQGIQGKAPAAMSLEIQQVTSEGSLSRLFKTDVSWGKDNGNKITGMFDFINEESGYQLAVDFSQAYYTVDIDTPALPSDLFAPEVTLEDVKKFMGMDTPPMYVQSITFGRRSVMSIKTKHNLEKVTAAFNAAIKSVVDVNAAVDSSSKQLLDSLEMKVFVLGGSGQDAVQVISGFEGLIQYIKDGADYSAESPGAPIAYKLAYLDNTGTKFAYTTDFAEAHCTPQMTTIINGSSLTIKKNGEKIGKAELNYHAWVESGGKTCDLITANSINHDDGTVVPIGIDCKFDFASDAPGTVAIWLTAEELSDNFLDKTKKGENSFSFNYDPMSLSWQPGISGQNLQITASDVQNAGDDLIVTLDYSIDLL